VVTPDYVNVVLLDEEERFVLFRQTKYSVEGVSLAVVGGYLDPGEEPLTGARRELREETGYEAETWRSLGSYVIDGNRGVGTGHFFLATAGRPVAEIDADDLEEQQLVLLPRQQVEEALWAGEFKLMPWAAVVALALQHLDRG
jgi:ADP-ribose pyrophosphatase